MWVCDILSMFETDALSGKCHSALCAPGMSRNQSRREPPAAKENLLVLPVVRGERIAG
jgi:hypothetical protein